MHKLGSPCIFRELLRREVHRIFPPTKTSWPQSTPNLVEGAVFIATSRLRGAVDMYLPIRKWDAIPNAKAGRP